jgi:hypothetical protein
MYMKEKHFVLFAVYEDRIYTQLICDIRENGSFHHKGRVMHTDTKDHKVVVRNKDNTYFYMVCGREYMKGKEIHHLWDDGERCLVLGEKEHHKLHRGG